MDKEAIIAKIYEQIETVFDPEIPVDINALGLIYKVEIDDEGNVYLEMTLTSSRLPWVLELCFTGTKARPVFFVIMGPLVSTTCLAVDACADSSPS